MSSIFSWLFNSPKSSKQRQGTSSDSLNLELDVSTEDLYGGSYFSVENELNQLTQNQSKKVSNKSYLGNSSLILQLQRNQIMGTTPKRLNNMNAQKKKSMNLKNDRSKDGEYSDDLWRVLME